jgi:hypothetical protein
MNFNAVFRETPCRDCPDRKLKCHATCERYLALKAKAKELSDAKFDERCKSEAFMDAMYGPQKHIRKRKR